MTGVDGLQLRFPGTWWQIPLADPVAARESARALIVQAVGRADQHAQLRAELRRSLDLAMTEARSIDARRFAIAREIVPDIPIPAFLSIVDSTTELTAAASTEPGVVLDLFLAGLAHAAPATAATPAPDAAPAGPAERFAVGPSQVARRVRYRTVPADGEAPQITNLIVEFWMTVPGQKRVVLLVFTSPAAELVQPLLNLFGAIVASARWPENR
ncbi:hypothetical protein D6T64_10500 [Cryobacterium melibiosiphilum]|uniref:Uncharacterized protein n=1 Tax=Cryobacterium melibiosiphilum TaxID=995039 RepID=A0A3A5MN38_9MICO|nr:hypothetical protein [Cryobacterium melibiosiphilum]RJT88548.1 hypothetical protein D6T64_10500 [Cryobacterium melibiosiphilum]